MHLLPFLLVFFLAVFSQLPSSSWGRSIPIKKPNPLPRFAEAPDYRNGEGCPHAPSASFGACNPTDVHIAMTLDLDYLRGSLAAVLSVLRHASCPNSIFFHFLASKDSDHSAPLLHRLVRSAFPSLRFKVYAFRDDLVSDLISSSVREALEKPLNYARNHLADILEPCVRRVIYLDSDVLVVDDIRKLWSTRIPHPGVIAAPEYCHANFTKYFTDAFWADANLSAAFDGRKKPPCYFNTGVMVMDLARWRKGGYGEKIRHWMEVQKKGSPRIYDLGSLPPFLLVFAGDVQEVDHRWNQHGLGGDNVLGSCRPLHPGPVSLLHWSGKGKPWARLDAGTPCPLDHLWAPYDLHLPPVPHPSHTSL